jgi:cytochrome c2
MTRPSLTIVASALRLAMAALAVGAAGCRDAPSDRAQFVPGGDPERGRNLVATYGCGGCHHVPGVPGAYGGVGPSFVGFADRAFIAGSLRNEPAQVVEWIRFPQRLRPGTAMPTLGVTEADAGDIAAYLYTLGRGGLGPPRVFPSSTLPAH